VAVATAAAGSGADSVGSPGDLVDLAARWAAAVVLHAPDYVPVTCQSAFLCDMPVISLSLAPFTCTPHRLTQSVDY